MKKARTVLLAVVMSSMVLTAMPIKPAGAATAPWASALLFACKAEVGAPGLTFPNPLGGPKPASLGWTLVCGKGKAPKNALDPNLCLAVGGGVGKPTQAAEQCNINLAGQLGPKPPLNTGPWCGNSQGFGGGGSIGTNSKTLSVFNLGWFSKGSLLLIQGQTSKGGTFVALVLAVGHLGKGTAGQAGSCNFLTGASAVQFLAAGVGVVVGNKG